MDTARTTLRMLTAARRGPRLLAALVFAAALVALPAARPDDAGAMKISERKHVHNCIQGGGSIYYEFWGENVFEAICYLPGGDFLGCTGVVGNSTLYCDI